jgi:acyl dehydratase
MKEWYFDDIPLNQPRMTREYVVPEEEMVSFARRWDPLPIHTDRKAAKASPHGGLIAPASYTISLASALVQELDPKIAFIGGLEWKTRFSAPVRPGDRLVATCQCVEKRASRTKPDRGIARFMTTMHNQRGETVITSEMTTLVSRGKPVSIDDTPRK